MKFEEWIQENATMYRGNNASNCMESAFNAGIKEGMRREWIAVEDRLPNNRSGAKAGRVLVHSEASNATGMARYTKAKKWHDKVDIGFAKISHWMPLPLPPKAEREV